LERFTKVVPIIRDLLAALARLDPLRRVAQGVAAPAGQAGTPHQLERDLRRWDVFPGKKRGDCVGKTKRGKGTKIMTLVDGDGTPLGATIASASPAEVTLIEPLLDQRIVRRRPKRLIYDKAADSDALRTRLARRGIELICPHRKNRKRPPLQDGRSLRRYCRRWKVERSIAWLGNFRRVVVRYERHAALFQGFVHLACLFTILQRF
jgi:transposase